MINRNNKSKIIITESKVVFTSIDKIGGRLEKAKPSVKTT